MPVIDLNDENVHVVMSCLFRGQYDGQCRFQYRSFAPQALPRAGRRDSVPALALLLAEGRVDHNRTRPARADRNLEQDTLRGFHL